jgi:ribosomal protein S18 acetylase RimI-like enzyme
MMSGHSAARVELIAFEPAWLDELVLMWRESFEDAVGITDPHSLDEQKQYFLREVVPQYEVRLAVREDRLVGFVAASEGSIAQLYVRVGFQRLGIGSQMLAWARIRSSGSLWLHTFARNHGARAFYERSGFVVVEHGFESTWRLEDIKYCWSAAAEDHRGSSRPRSSRARE